VVLRRDCETGLLLEPVRRHPIQRAAEKAAPPIDHPGIVFHGQTIRKGSSMPLLGELVSKLRRLWKSYGEALPSMVEGTETDGAVCAADTTDGTAPELGS
jgi:hypothetical protein